MISSNLPTQLDLLVTKPSFSYLVKEDAMCLIPTTSITGNLGTVLVPGAVTDTSGQRYQAVFQIDTNGADEHQDLYVQVSGSWLRSADLERALGAEALPLEYHCPYRVG